jgi:hypothetical protein
MRFVAFICFLFACSVSFQTTASAQERIYPYCMETGDSGGSVVNCSYESLAQCMASKAGSMDKCYENPKLAGRK